MKRRLNIGSKQTVPELQAVGYFEDGLSQMNGEGFNSRRALFHGGKTFKSVCSLDVDIFQQQKLLPNNLLVDIEITPHNNAFALLSNGNEEYKYEILDCRLFVKHYLLNPELHNSIQEKLDKGAFAKYNYTRNMISHYFISPGRMDFETVLFRDKLPKRVFAGLVDARAFNGEIGKSPFAFEPHYLQSIQIRADGKHVPSYPYKMNWNENDYIRAYKDLSDTTEHSITLAKYETHSAFYGLDLQLDHNKEIVELQKTGSTYISLNFSVPVPVNGLQLVIYGEFDSILALDDNRQITKGISV
uniref:Uncharacterized protein n=1 Tax=Panagrolaimus superbus TaxID=310955 RepID=A0A914ZCA8_9BILA